MADYTAKNVGDMEALYGGGFVKARAELGVTAFGLQVIQLPPDYSDYPEHDHSDSGQEEALASEATVANRTLAPRRSPTRSSAMRFIT